ncbi:MAG: hypothetical protein WCX17_00070 [Parcubacteria group bacterium]|jgi:hypothetical protein
MILATHELVGAAIGAKIHSPWLIIIFSLAMHFVLDTFRHGEYVESFDSKVAFKNTWHKVALDFFIGIIVILIYLAIRKPNSFVMKDIFLGVFFSILPDFITFIYWKYRFAFLEKYYAFHSWCHKYPRNAPERAWNLRNAANDIIISLIAIIILFIK